MTAATTAADAERIAAVFDAERRRGEALVAGDIATLRTLLAPDLTHTHTRGVTDDLESFLHFVEHDIRYLAIDRDAMKVRLVGDVAIMTGNQTNRIHLRAMAEPMTSRSHAVQVWACLDGHWRMHAFQSTNLPAEASDPFSSFIRR